MSTVERTKINQLLSECPRGVVLLSSWLSRKGYSLDLQKHYRKTQWLQSIGKGAQIRAFEKIGYEGAIYALQKQEQLTIHPGGRTALTMLGKSHYLELGAQKVFLFGDIGEKLPNWLKKYNWGVRLDFYETAFLPPGIGMTDFENNGFSIRISGAARALLECLYLAPGKQELVECFELMEGLTNLYPTQVQQLLESCRSVKVKRLFLFMAEKADHQWLKKLDLSRVDLGKGKRSLVKGGTFVDKYGITVPKELAGHGKSL